MKRAIFCFWIIVFFLLFGCRPGKEFGVLHRTAGPIKTNSYLIYGTKSREAALVDPGWRIDSLVNFINQNALQLKYILITHGRIDLFLCAAD